MENIYSTGRNWKTSRGIHDVDYTNDLSNFKVYGYGVNRGVSESTVSESAPNSNSATLFYSDKKLVNLEGWLSQLEIAKINGTKKAKEKAKEKLDKIKKLLTSGLMPDIQDFRFTTDDNLKNFMEFKTDYGWIPFNKLGYGYQTSMSWIIDFAKKMFERYPTSKNPFSEPAVVLVDEIDLHLHPEWQRKILGFLTEIFPNTQLIVTAHSPLVVQSAEKVNLVILSKKRDGVEITQPKIPTFKGWTVEEILMDMMGLDDRTYSDQYLKLMKDFDDALDRDDFEQAQIAFDELDKIIHPASSQRKTLEIQLLSIVHD